MLIDPKRYTVADFLDCVPGDFLLKLPARPAVGAERWIVASDADQRGVLHAVVLSGKNKFSSAPVTGREEMVLVFWDGPVLVDLDEEQEARNSSEAGNLLIADDGMFMVVVRKKQSALPELGYLSLSDFSLRSSPPTVQGIYERWNLLTAPQENLPSMPLITGRAA